jgi:hypothetical protein
MKSLADLGQVSAARCRNTSMLDCMMTGLWGSSWPQGSVSNTSNTRALAGLGRVKAAFLRLLHVCGKQRDRHKQPELADAVRAAAKGGGGGGGGVIVVAWVEQEVIAVRVRE